MDNPVCIIGFGRLGETLAGILKPHFAVTVIEADAARARQARGQGYQTAELKDAGNYKTIFICVPISAFEFVAARLAPRLSPGTLVMDVCSVKVFPARIMREVFPPQTAIIATHPLFGPDSIGKGLDKLAIVTYPVRAAAKIHRQWDDFWKGLGLNVITASPEEHDQATAYTLGMTHFFGRIMGELKLEPHAITTIGYNALYEVMRQTNRDTWQLFHDMQHYNPYAKEMRDKVFAAIRAIEAKLDEAIR